MSDTAVSRTEKSALSQIFILYSLKVELKNNKKKFFNIKYSAKEDKLIYYIKLI